MNENTQFLNNSGKHLTISKRNLKSFTNKIKSSFDTTTLISKENHFLNKKVSVNKKITKKPKKNKNRFSILKRVKNLKILQNYRKEESLKKQTSFLTQDTPLSTKLETPFKFQFPLKNNTKTNENFKISKYLPEILQNLNKARPKCPKTPKIPFTAQTEITKKMRTILINWIIMVHKNFKLKEATLFLAITIIDRYTARKLIKRKNYQLLGITALYMASKFEEIYPPKLAKFVYICDKAFLKSDIVDFESCVLLGLEFRVCIASSYYFLESVCYMFGLGNRVLEIGTYFLYLSFYEYKCMDLKESLKCLVSLYFALRYLDRFSMFENICCLKFFKFSDFEFHRATQIFEILSKKHNQEQFSAIRKKFGSFGFSYENLGYVTN